MGIEDIAPKLVFDDGKRADQVIESHRTNAKQLAERRAAQYREAKVKHPPTVEAILAVIEADAALLEARRDALRTANRELDAELGDDMAVLAERDRAAEVVRSQLVEVRESVTVNCGDTAASEAGFEGKTRRDPVALAEHGHTVHANITAKPPKASRRGVRFDALAAIEGLDVAVKALVRANADVLREKREEQASRQRRDEAWEGFEREASTSQGRLDANLRAVGLDALADRIVTSKGARVEG